MSNEKEIHNDHFVGDDGIDWSSHAIDEFKKGYFVSPDKSAFDYFSELLPAGSLVVEIGCNIGRWADVFLLYNCKYIGVDASSAAINIATKHFADNPNVTFIQKYAEGLLNYYQDYHPLFGNIDIVFTNTVLQHLHLDNKKRVIAAVKQILRPGGFLIIQEVIDQSNIRAFGKAGWIKFITSFGFEFIKATEDDDPRHGFVFRKK